MPKPSDEAVQDLIRRAAEIASSVPESLREAAFHRALDMLSGIGTHERAGASGIPAGEQRRPVRDSAAKKPEKTDSTRTERLIQEIDRTKHPSIINGKKVLDRALALLLVAKEHHDEDGLTAAEMAKVLTDKFRVRTSETAVRMAMDRAPEYVDRIKRGSAFVYRIMAAGEEYLGKIEAGETGARPKAPPRRTARKAPKQAANNGENTPARGRRSSGRPGPKRALEDLLSAGFFREPRTISDVIAHLSSTRALTYATTDMSPTLVRLLREGKLARARNTSGQYEYTSAA